MAIARLEVKRRPSEGARPYAHGGLASGRKELDELVPEQDVRSTAPSADRRALIVELIEAHVERLRRDRTGHVMDLHGKRSELPR